MSLASLCVMTHPWEAQLWVAALFPGSSGLRFWCTNKRMHLFWPLLPERSVWEEKQATPFGKPFPCQVVVLVGATPYNALTILLPADWIVSTS